MVDWANVVASYHRCQTLAGCAATGLWKDAPLLSDLGRTLCLRWILEAEPPPLDLGRPSGRRGDHKGRGTGGRPQGIANSRSRMLGAASRTRPDAGEGVVATGEVGRGLARVLRVIYTTKSKWAVGCNSASWASLSILVNFCYFG